MTTKTTTTKSTTTKDTAAKVDAEGRSAGPLGLLLRTWRRARGLSQLALATKLHVSPRHLSFVETGRSSPSRDMVLHLADGLGVPLRERNALLLAAGYAPLYGEADLDAPELAPVRRAIQAILTKHEPYPAVVLDRGWNLLDANRAARLFFAFMLGDGPRPERPNILDAMFDPTLVRPYVVDWEAVAGALIQRVHREAVGGIPDPDLIARLLAYPGVPESWRAPRPQEPCLPVVPVGFRKGGRRFDYFSTVTTVGTAQDVTLQEIRIESFFPLDEETAAQARRLAESESV